MDFNHFAFCVCLYELRVADLRIIHLGFPSSTFLDGGWFVTTSPLQPRTLSGSSCDIVFSSTSRFSHFHFLVFFFFFSLFCLIYFFLFILYLFFSYLFVSYGFYTIFFYEIEITKLNITKQTKLYIKRNNNSYYFFFLF